MPDFSASAPAEATKSGAFLHDRSRIPEPPPSRTPDLVRRYLPIAVGFAFAMGFMALAFQTRATWGTHRDWVIPATVPAWVLGGVALGHLADRRAFVEMLPGVGLLLLAVALTAMNIWRGEIIEGPDAGRDAMTIVTALLLVASLVALVGASVWVEATRPTKAPPPQI